jgi:dTDP-6-deoxy-L-talose 4-dehydrogenase (NAD+)
LLEREFPHVEPITTDDLFSERVEWWEERCAGVDVVIHLAWYAEPGKYLQSQANVNCLIGSLHLGRAAVNARVKRFVGVGSCFEYDLNANVLTVETPLKPRTPYAATKVSLFLTLASLLPAEGVDFAWCRLFYLYGENEHADRLVPYLRSRLSRGEPADLTSGEQIRDYLDVAEAGRMVADAALGSKTGPINICSERPVTVRQLAETIADQYQCRDLLRFGARPENKTDPRCVIGIR